MDDIDKITTDGRIVISGIFFDMDELERVMNDALVGPVAAHRLAQSGQRIAPLRTCGSTETKIFKTAPKALKNKLDDNAPMSLSFTRYFNEMLYKIGIIRLQRIAYSDIIAPVETSVSRVDRVGAETAQEITCLFKGSSAPIGVPFLLTGFNFITIA